MVDQLLLHLLALVDLKRGPKAKSIGVFKVNDCPKSILLHPAVPEIFSFIHDVRAFTKLIFIGNRDADNIGDNIPVQSYSIAAIRLLL